MCICSSMRTCTLTHMHTHAHTLKQIYIWSASKQFKRLNVKNIRLCGRRHSPHGCAPWIRKFKLLLTSQCPTSTTSKPSLNCFRTNLQCHQCTWVAPRAHVHFPDYLSSQWSKMENWSSGMSSHPW